MARIARIECKIEFADGRTCEAAIDADGSIFRSGEYEAMCDAVEPTEDMRAALFDGGHMGSADDEADEAESEL